MVSYATTVTALSCYPEYEGLQDVVFTVAWTMTGTDNVNSGEYRGKTSVPFTAGSPFTPYAQLTPEQVLSWVDRNTPASEIVAARAFIDNQITAQQNAITTASPPLPW